MSCFETSINPAASIAENVIVDFCLKINSPNADFLQFPGNSFSLLGENQIFNIKNALKETVLSINPNAPLIYKAAFVSIIIVNIVLMISFIIAGTNGAIPGVIVCFVLFAVINFIFTLWFNSWCKKWTNSVLNPLLNYCKNEFNKSYNFDISVLYPVIPISDLAYGNDYHNINNRHRRHGRRRRFRSIYFVIRITNGTIQQPYNGPLYWTSAGNIMQSVIIKKPDNAPVEEENKINETREGEKDELITQS